MEVTLLLTQKIIYLFLFMISGFILVKAGCMKPEDTKSISYMFSYIISPGSVFFAFQIACTEEVKKGVGFAFILATVSSILAILFVFLIRKHFHLKPIEQATAFLTNAGAVVLPLVRGVYGNDYAIYALAYIALSSLVLWTVGEATIAEQNRFNIKKILTNTNIIALAAGAVVFIFQIKLPKPIYDFAQSCSDMVGPMCMLITGVIMGGLDLHKTFTDKRLYFVTMLRLVIIPLPVLLLFRLLPLAELVKDGAIIIHIVIMAAMAPVAANVVQISQIYDKDYNYASALNFSTTFFCVLTMPLMTLLYEMI